MSLQISSTFSSQIPRLDSKIAGLAWSFLSKFIQNPEHPSFKLERVEKAKDPTFWSARLNQQYRVIVSKKDGETTVCYVDKHDEAYRWAETHILKLNNTTRLLQIIKVQEPIVIESLPSRQTAVGNILTEPESKSLFAERSDDYLKSIGIPEELLSYVKMISSEEMLLKSEEHFITIPEIFNKLLSLVDGALPPPILKPKTDKLDSEAYDGEGFHRVQSVSDLAPLLKAPFATWLVFLHPTQVRIVEYNEYGCLKVNGSAGTGKTVAAVHRAVHLAKKGKRVLLCSYTNMLVTHLKELVNLLTEHLPEVAERIDIETLHSIAKRVCKEAGQKVSPIATNDDFFQQTINEAASIASKDPSWMQLEWEHVVEHYGIKTLEDYLTIERVGRKTRLTQADRKKVWLGLEHIFKDLNSRKKVTWKFLCDSSLEIISKGKYESPYDVVILDESQDLGYVETKFALSLSKNNLNFFGDATQRIYAKPISHEKIGIDVRGRSFVLKINYRTTCQIRSYADKVDLNVKAKLLLAKDRSHRGVVSTLAGPEPTITAYQSYDEENEGVCSKIAEYLRLGMNPSDIAVIGYSESYIRRFSGLLKEKGIERCWLKDTTPPDETGVRILHMYRAKGMEFRVVFVVGCSEEEFQNQTSNLDDMNDVDTELEKELLEKLTNLYYVAFTRARDELHISYVGKKSSLLV